MLEKGALEQILISPDTQTLDSPNTRMVDSAHANVASADGAPKSQHTHTRSFLTILKSHGPACSIQVSGRRWSARP